MFIVIYIHLLIIFIIYIISYIILIFKFFIYKEKILIFYFKLLFFGKNYLLEIWFSIQKRDQNLLNLLNQNYSRSTNTKVSSFRRKNLYLLEKFQEL